MVISRILLLPFLRVINPQLVSSDGMAGVRAQEMITVKRSGNELWSGKRCFTFGSSRLSPITSRRKGNSSSRQGTLRCGHAEKIKVIDEFARNN